MFKKHEINIHSEAEAFNRLNDDELHLQDREDGIEYLRNNPTPAAIDRLVTALEDAEFGIRWSAATALAQMGDAALVPLLKALTQPRFNLWLREGAKHVFQHSSSYRVQKETEELRSVLFGIAADLSTMWVAWRLLNRLNKQGYAQSHVPAAAEKPIDA